MSNNQTSENRAMNALWKDWKVDLGFFISLNKYLVIEGKSLTEIMKGLIDKTKAGGDVAFKDIIYNSAAPTVEHMASGVVAVFNLTKECAGAKDDSFELLSSLASWIDGLRAAYKDDSSKPSDNVQASFDAKSKFIAEMFTWVASTKVDHSRIHPLTKLLHGNKDGTQMRTENEVKGAMQQYKNEFNKLLEHRWKEIDFDKVFLTEINSYVKQENTTFATIVEKGLPALKTLVEKLPESHVKFILSGVIMVAELAQMYSSANKKVSEFLKTISRWIDDTRNQFNEKKGEFEERVWHNLREKSESKKCPNDVPMLKDWSISQELLIGIN